MVSGVVVFGVLRCREGCFDRWVCLWDSRCCVCYCLSLIIGYVVGWGVVGDCFGCLCVFVIVEG